MENNEILSLSGKRAIVTGGAGLLGKQHAEALLEIGAEVILWDINEARLQHCMTELKSRYAEKIQAVCVDITQEINVVDALNNTLQSGKTVDILINNAACNPHVQKGSNMHFNRLECLSLQTWKQEIDVGLTGAFLCAKHIGIHMAEQCYGVIVNISSDLGVIAPDQRIYRQQDISDDQQPVKPITYSVVKHGVIGLTKYLATYWADKNVRVNALSMGGVYVDQPDEFVEKLTNLIPMGRMACLSEYKGAIQFLCSDASKYMTGQNIIMDGGRTVW